MKNIVFDRDTLEVTGLNRPVSPSEIELKNIDVPMSMSKTIMEDIDVVESNDSGEDLYILTLTERQETGQIKVLTKEMTDEPAMQEVSRREPLMQDGEQVSYETEEGQTIYCYHNVTKEERMYDEAGNKLYYRTEPVYSEVILGEEKITEMDERWTPELPKSYIKKPTYRNVVFENDMDKFNYGDFIAVKETQLIMNSLYSEAKLFEHMPEEMFSKDLTSFNAHLGYDFITVPDGGQIRTEKINFLNPHQTVGIKTETAYEGLEVSVGELASDLQPIDKFNERKFPTPVSSVYVMFKNNTGKPIDIYSFAVMG